MVKYKHKWLKEEYDDESSLIILTKTTQSYSQQQTKLIPSSSWTLIKKSINIEEKNWTEVWFYLKETRLIRGWKLNILIPRSGWYVLFSQF